MNIIVDYTKQFLETTKYKQQKLYYYLEFFIYKNKKKTEFEIVGNIFEKHSKLKSGFIFQLKIIAENFEKLYILNKKNKDILLDYIKINLHLFDKNLTKELLGYLGDFIAKEEENVKTQKEHDIYNQQLNNISEHLLFVEEKQESINVKHVLQYKKKICCRLC
jgi:hypothetical protein